MLGGGRFDSIAVVTATAALLAAGARADTPPISIEWRAPAGCPSQGDVLSEIHRLLGGAPGDGAGRKVNARASVARATAGWSMALETETNGAKGRRALEAPTCRELSTAAALIVALAFDPDAVAKVKEREQVAVASAPPPSVRPPASQPEPASSASPGAPLAGPAAATPPAAPPVDDGAPRPAPVTRSPPTRDRVEPARREPSAVPSRFDVGAHLAADLGSLPGPALGGGLDLGFARGALALRGAGTIWLPQTGHVDASPGQGGEFDFLTAAAVVCWLPLRERVEVGACGGGEIGWMHAQGFGVSVQREDEFVWLAIPLGGTAVLRASRRTSVRLDVGGAVPLRRPRWTLGNVGGVDRPGPVSARASAAFDVSF